ncbi:serine/threonine-protein kinase [Roseimaritima sediminicola]|uniref:serine/threonine-protein kinase n=1 Tax=Roseimaritima sediminicola TaxID=2662066 RepID=UPI001386EB67|nr:serine/threonine-protein kinase [Roseimaritima sediminicola]
MSDDSKHDDTVRDLDRFASDDAKPDGSSKPAAGAEAGGASQLLACPLQPGSQFGRYEIIEAIDAGGMGMVYRAMHRALNKQVALKVISPNLRFDARAMERFLREMKAIGRLESHPNVLHAYDAGEEHGVQYLATEFIEGVQLGELLRKLGPLSVSEACTIVSQAAVALEHLRKHELVHRDIKPTNLMLTRDGTVKLVDMGLALLRDDQNDQLTSFGETMGSVDYMAPEQWKDSHNVDWRSDVYSLGCTFYCLLAGHAPYSKRYRGSLAKLRAHLDAEFPDIREERSDVPERAAALIAGMVCKDPDRRVVDLPEIAEQLSIIAAGDLRSLAERGFASGLAAHPPNSQIVASQQQPIDLPLDEAGSGADSNAETRTFHMPLAAGSRKRSNSALVGWAFAAVAVVVLGAALWMLADPPARRPPLPADRVAAEGVLPDGGSPEGVLPEGVLPADGTVDDGTPAETVAPAMTVIGPSGPTHPPRSLNGMSDTVHGLTFVAGMDRLAAVSKEGRLCLYDLNDPTEPIHTVSVSSASADEVVFDPTGPHLVVASADGWLRRHAHDDGRALEDIVQRTAGLTGLARVPDQQAYLTTDWNGDVWRSDWNEDAVDDVLIAHRSDALYDVAMSPDGRWMAWCGRQAEVTLYDTTSGVQRDLQGHTDWVVDIEFSPDGTTLASASHEGKVLLWKTADATLHDRIEFVVPQRLCYLPNSSYLAIGGRGSQCEVWDTAAVQCVLRLPTRYHIDSLAVDAAAEHLAVGCNNGTLTLWRLPEFLSLDADAVTPPD